MSQYLSSKNKLIKGDSTDKLKKLKDNSVDLLCTDPPYGYGFMGKNWDNTLPPREIFEESLRVLKPGSFAFVMSAPRSDVQYRMAQMLDEVGFEIGYTPIYWTYSTGFPKAMNIGKAVDKRLGKERKVVGKHPDPRHKYLNTDIRSGNAAGGGHTNAARESGLITAPASDEAKKLDGSYAGYQPKPAVEVVIVAMKPLEKKGYLDQALDNGKGVTWLDSCRIPFAGMSDEEQKDYERVSAFGDSDQSETDDGRNLWGKKATKKVKITKRQPRTDHNVFKQSGFKSEENDTAEASPLGRFVANLVVSDDVLKEDFSRYYSLDAWWRDRFKRLPEEIQRTFPFLVVPKASKSEKNMGLDKFEVKQKDERTDIGKGSFTEKGLQPGKNVHPTVKPMTLMSYLVTLGSRKNDVVLDPFMGSGTTPMACVTLSRNYIGIEREDEYFKIAEARVNKLENPIKQWEQWI